MSFLDDLISHAQEVYGTLSHNERIKERSRAYTESVKQGLLSNFPMLAKDPREVNAADIIGSGFGAMPLAIKAWHGSPHKFDKFDMSKIGTGANGQTFGRGLYFTESPEVAYKYSDPSANNESGLPAFVSYLKEIGASQDEISMYEKAITNPGESASLYESSLQWPDAAKEAADPLGPQHFLDWHKPLSEQPENIKAALAPYIGEPTIKDGMPLAGGGTLRIVEDSDFGPKYFLEMGGQKMRLSPGDIKNLIGSGIEGKSAYQNASEMLGGEGEASSMLSKAGIPGIRYQDQGSSGASSGLYNYVVFDDQIPRIVKRNGAFFGLFPGDY